MQPAAPELPASRADLEEEEEQHEHQAGADVQDQTQAHVHAGEAQDPASGGRVEPDLGPLGPPPVQHCRRRPGGGLLLLQGLDSALGFLGGLGRRRRGGGQVALRLGEVARGEVGRAVVLAEEGQDLLLVPGVDALLLLVTGGAEGGAGPGRLREHRVVAEGTCKTREIKGTPSDLLDAP